jgi:UDP-2,3-diacylglucosamine pyrophosphatase LpxH
MKKNVCFFYPLFIALFLILSTSCRKTETDPAPAIDPFANGTSVRNMIVVLSDMHMGADETYTECKDNRAPLAKLLGQMRVSANVKEIVIAGDLIDEWFVPANVDTYEGKDQADFVKRLAATNKIVFDVLNQIIKEGTIKVTYVPGNHDLAITADNVSLILPGISQARDAQQGLGTYTPADFTILAIEHGHRYNFSCAPDPISNKDIAPGSIMPPGYFFTRIAALAANQGVSTPGDVLPKIIPVVPCSESQSLIYDYWSSWVGLVEMFPITNKFSDPIIITNINGFTQTYSVDDIVPYQLPSGIIDVNLFKGIYDTANWNQREVLNQVAVKFPVTQAMADADDNSKTDNQAKTQYFLNADSDKRIVVFGHTHEPEIIASNNSVGEYCIYANSGTWIDNNPHQTTMNFVVITPENTTDIHSQTYVKLYNFMNDVVSLMAVDELRYTK